MRTRPFRTALVAVAALAVLAVTACGDSDSGGAPADGGDPGITGTVTVFAAASLTESFTTIGRNFEAANPGVKVTFSFAGSSALANQINQGAPADVFASAAPANMKTVTGAGNGDGTPTTFVKNQLVIAVPKGNPDGVTGLVDLTGPDAKVALCAEQVPCGAAARKALDAAGVELTPVTLEQDVKAALAKVRLGEVDAALVYRTDAKAGAAEVDGIEFPESAGAVNDYPIIVLKDAANPAAARAFVSHVLSDAGRGVLTAAGFQAP
ncbi:molybdate ABC transporter substrate-binding protein [Plantactinospora sp. S1510]|uniref:Molybdate ABC transporter substrate-binding protein n=1 Tax=Plantactinospora alkalitolerans TaxID=2789879 RepID=A0ABS0GYX1_9ACTN|nr:molybdate ABC transporter substrate-binding protein [Plantactinospora alkalitolerans]MBF9131138.1 molybdate ABC transporter substrate-binding protein [Plantactinospora alkalitolerans]